jgi:Response regulator containing CheY-like receiver, AAA-type ATPase, and DNA-binding domains
MVSENSSRRLLVVDDEPLVRQTLSLVLKDEYDVTTVASGEEAVAASMQDTFPVVILDLCMEGMSGIETLQRLKKIRDSQNIIILTAYESTESAIAALNLGAFNYLTKPFERHHLRKVVSQGFDVFHRHAARKEDMQRRLMGVHDSFFSLLCHEFNTPLNVILGFSDLLAASPRDKEVRNWIEHIREAGTHLHDILMEIVDYTAASHLATAGVEEIFTPRELLLPIVRTLQEKSIAAILEDTLPQGTKVSGSSEAILMIVRKLATMASQRSKRIHIRTALEHRDGAHLRVTLGGTGIFERSLEGRGVEKLFEPYEVSAKGSQGYTMSLGLELATCRKIADYAHASVEGRYDARGELEFDVLAPVQVIL